MKRSSLCIIAIIALFVSSSLVLSEKGNAGSSATNTEAQGPVGPAVDNNPGRRLRSLSLQKNSVVGGTELTGSVLLQFLAPTGGTRVNLTTDPVPGIEGENLAFVPSGVTVPKGEARATFQIKTGRVQSTRQVKIIASAGGVTKTSDLTLVPLQVQSLVIVPPAGLGPFQAQGTVRLNVPAPPNTTVSLTTSNPEVVRFGTFGSAQGTSSLPFERDQSFKTFQIVTSRVSQLTNITVRATLNGNTVSSTVTVRPIL